MNTTEIKKRYAKATDKMYAITELAEQNNVTRKEIKRILAESDADYQRDYDSGMLDSEIAKKHKVKTVDVAEWRKGRGLVRNSRKKLEAEGVTIRDAIVVTEPAEVVPTPSNIVADKEFAMRTITNTDAVTRPAHYTQGEIETIDYIRDKLTADEFIGYCKGNILKYISREQHKNGTEDLKKAQVYLAWAIERREGDR